MGRTLSSDSANVIALPASPTGFTAGDYVYQTTSGYGSVPSGALATGLFNVNNVPIEAYASTATTSNEFTYVEQLGGSMGSQVAALLTNGNIVYVYLSGNTAVGAAATVNFRIETTGGTVVVAETSTTMAAYFPYQASVVAIANGTFAIVCTPLTGNYSLSTRFYNNDGTAATAVLAAGLNLILAQAVCRLKLQVLSDNSVIIGYTNNAVFELRRVTTAGFDATFGAAGVRIVFDIGSATSQFWDYIVDGSNNIQTIHLANSGSLVMRRYNSVGVQQATSTVSTGLTGLKTVAIAIASDGTMRGFAQQTSGINVVTWNGTTAALSTQIVTGSSSVNAALGAFAQGASGGYVLFYTSVSATNTIPLNVQAFSSSNVALASAATLTDAQAIGYRTQFTPIVVSGDTRVYFGLFQGSSVNMITTGSGRPPMGIMYFAYSNTTYGILNSPTINYNFTGLGPIALGPYVRNGSTPGIAKFTVGSTGTYSSTFAAGAELITKTFVDGTNTATQLVLAPLPNGEFVAAWQRTNGAAFPTFISKYSSSGVLLAGPITVQATGVLLGRLSVGVVRFANGNILVTYSDTITAIRFRIYTSSLTLVTSGDVDTAATVTSNSGSIAVSTFGAETHAAIVYSDTSGYMTTRTISDAGVVSGILFQDTGATRWYNLSVVGFKSSAFFVGGVSTTGIRSGRVIRQTAPSTFSAGTTFDFNNAVTYSFSGRLSSPMPAVGTSAFMIGNDAGNLIITSINPGANSVSQLQYNTLPTPFSGSITSSGTWSAATAYTGTGTPVVVSQRNNTTTALTLAPIANSTLENNTSVTVSPVTTTLLTNQTSSNVCISAIPHIGEAVLVGYTDNNQYPAFVSLAASAFTTSFTLTAGTDVSTSTLMLTPEGGFSLQGISITAAASGNSGFVQTTGTATLNSNYSAATPAIFFDSRNPITAGTNGTVVGRTVIMGNN
jgi:hypothetical protein